MLETLVRHLDMVRLTAVFGAALAVGCVGLIDGGGSNGPSKRELADKAWAEQAQPVLAQLCVSCHAGQRANVGFLTGDDPEAQRATLMAFTPAAVNLEAPSSSRILTKGVHEGTALSAADSASVLAWIQAEKEAETATTAGPSNEIRTASVQPMLCTAPTGSPDCPVNEIALDDLGNGIGIAGAKISFVAQAIGNSLYLTNLKLVPGAGGAFIEHPLFVSIGAEPGADAIADQIDRYYNVKMNLQMAATTEQQFIGGGAAAFLNFPPQNQIAVLFKAAKLFQPEVGTPGGQTGCKKLPEFETNARAALNTNCGSCHANANNVNAVSGLDLQGIGQANATNACNQTRTRINFQNIDGSALFLTTAPGNNNHPFTFGGNAAAHTAFKTALNPWITAERDAP